MLRNPAEQPELLRIASPVGTGRQSAPRRRVACSRVEPHLLASAARNAPKPTDLSAARDRDHGSSAQRFVLPPLTERRAEHRNHIVQQRR